MRQILLLTSLTIYFVGCIYGQTSQQLYETGLIHFKLADQECYHDQEELKKAIQVFEKAIKKGYTERDIFHKLSLSYHWLNQDIKNAERVYAIGLVYYPNDIEFYFRRGTCKKELKQYKAAFEDYNKAIQLDSSKYYEYINDVIYQRGAMRYLLGDKINADKDWEAAQEITDHELRTYDDYCRLWK